MPIDREAMRLHARLPVHQRRIQRARAIVAQGLSTMRRPYLSCSFGKDSVALLHMVLPQAPNIPVVFINSNYCFPDTYAVRDRFVREYGINLVEISQPHDYLEVIDQYGLPEERSPATQQRVVRLLKKDLANEWAQANGYDGNYWGLRKEESAGRRWLLRTKGPLFLAGNGLWRCAPLADWTWEDVWAYIHANDVPYSGIYDKTLYCDPRQIRNTSWVTTDGAARNGRLAWLRHYYPDLYERLTAAVPAVKMYL